MTKSKPEFGKRGREKETVERKPTVMERLKKAGRRLWAKKDTDKKNRARPKGFRR
jgi:hypothetical protein